MTIQYTTNYSIPYPGYDDTPFIDAFQTAIIMIDNILGDLVAEGGIVVTAWDNSTAYNINDKVIDTDNSRMYQAGVGHTSSASGTFAEDRVANPTYWTAFGTPLVSRGAWAQSTAYAVLDHVYDASEGVSAICSVAHTSTSSGTIRTDAANWLFIVDITISLSDSVTGQLILGSQIFGG